MKRYINKEGKNKIIIPIEQFFEEVNMRKIILSIVSIIILVIALAMFILILIIRFPLLLY